MLQLFFWDHPLLINLQPKEITKMSNKSEPKPESKEQNKTILVCGATGAQGGAVVNALLEDGFNVRGLTRNPQSPAAKLLTSKGVEIFTGNFNNEKAIMKAAEGVHGMYIMMTPFEEGTEAEVKQGLSLIDAAIEAEVEHLILSSVASANMSTRIPHFESKYEVEKYLTEMAKPAGLNYTIVAPVYFMENLISQWLIGPLKEGLFTQALNDKRPLQQVALRDLGQFVAALIKRGVAVYGKRYEVASDVLTGVDEAQILSRVTGRHINYKGFSPDIMRKESADMADMFEWFDKTGYNVDILTLHKKFPEVNWHSFQDWADEQDWDLILASESKSIEEEMSKVAN